MGILLKLFTLLLVVVAIEAGKLTEDDDARIEDIVASYMSKLKEDASNCSLWQFYESGECHTCKHFCEDPLSKNCQAVCPFYAVRELTKKEANQQLQVEMAKVTQSANEQHGRDMMIIYCLAGFIIVMLLAIILFLTVCRKEDRRVKDVEEGYMDSEDTLLSDRSTDTRPIRQAADDAAPSTITSPSHM